MDVSMRALVVLLTLFFGLSACDTVRLTGKGGSQSKPEWGVQIGF